MAQITGTNDWEAVEIENTVTGRIMVVVSPLGKSVAVGDTVYPGCWPEYTPNWDYQGRGYSALPNCSGSVVTPSDPVNLVPGAHYNLTTAAAPAYTIKLDFNACDAIGGWGINLNDKLTAPQIDIKVDGVLYQTITATVVRTDVRDALIASGVLPPGTSFATYGWLHTKDDTYADGNPHTWRVYGKNTTIESTTDTNAPATITCGTSPVTPGAITQVKRNFSGSSILYSVFGTNLNFTDGNPFGLQTRYQVGSGAWSNWEGIPDSATATSAATYGINAGSGIATQFEVRIVYADFTVQANSTLHFDYTTPGAAVADAIIYP